MKKTLLAAVIVLAAQSVWAGVQYEFTQNTQSDIEQIPSTHLSGRAIIEGDRSRVDFVGGNIYAPGAYVISTDGSRTLEFVDPVTKSYSEVNASAVAAYGASNVTVTNLKTNVEQLPDSEVVAGVPTKHFHLTITYDMSVMYGSMPLKQSVREEIDKWTTTEFGDIADSFFAGGTIRSGNPEMDKIIDAETMLIKGFPMRQKTVITTVNPRGVAPGSQLALSSVRTQQRDLQILTIKRITADPKLFNVPTTFEKITGAQQASVSKQPKVTILTFDEPQAKKQ